MFHNTDNKVLLEERGCGVLDAHLLVSNPLPEVVRMDEANRRPAGVEGEVGAEHYHLVHLRLYNLCHRHVEQLESVLHSTFSARANWPPTRRPQI